MDRLIELLRTHSYREGSVTLSSGEVSDFFVDCKQTVLLAEGHAWIGERMLEVVRDLAPSARAVAGVELGGCPLASAVALTSFRKGRSLDAIYVRKLAKGHGSKRLVEGNSHLPRDTPVAVLEDVVTTGGSTLHAIQTLREAGLKPECVVAVVDRLQGGAQVIRDAGVSFASLYDRNSFASTR
ncbi:MAG: orotate phosphoribosyltransferase [Myxococcota bacterium]